MFDFCSINCGLNCRNEFGRRMVQQEFDSPSHEFGSHGQFNGPSSPISVLNQPLTKKQKEIPEKNSKNSKKKKNNNKSLNSNFNRRAEATAATKEKKERKWRRPPANFLVSWFHVNNYICCHSLYYIYSLFLSLPISSFAPLSLSSSLAVFELFTPLPRYPVNPMLSWFFRDSSMISLFLDVRQMIIEACFWRFFNILQPQQQKFWEIWRFFWDSSIRLIRAITSTTTTKKLTSLLLIMI